MRGTTPTLSLRFVANNLHVFGMLTYAIDQLIWFQLLGADFMNGREQWESVNLGCNYMEFQLIVI